MSSCKSGIPKIAKKITRVIPELADIVTGDNTLVGFVEDVAETVIDAKVREKKERKHRRALSMVDMIDEKVEARKHKQLIAEKTQVDITGDKCLYYDVFIGSYRIHASYPPTWKKPRHIRLAPVITLSPHEGNTIHQINYDDENGANVIIVDLDKKTILSHAIEQ